MYQSESTWVSGWHGVCRKQIRVSVWVNLGQWMAQSGSAWVTGSVTMCLGQRGSAGDSVCGKSQKIGRIMLE